MKRTILFFVILAVLLPVQARGASQNLLLHDSFAALPPDTFPISGDWFPYPSYEDRAGWDALTADFKDQIEKNCPSYIDYKWKVQTASSYLEYEKTGDRSLMKAEEENRKALICLTIAELAEGKGRFIPQIIDGLYFLSEQLSWAHAQHTRLQRSGRTLPTDSDFVISLHNAVTASAVAIAWHFFHREFDKADPSISRTIYYAMNRQIFEPFMDESKDSDEHIKWMGFENKEDQVLNNWTPYCNFHVLLSFLLMEKDQELLKKAIDRSTRSMDSYLEYIKKDGACEEGPGYWSMSFGVVLDYCCMLKDATGGRMDVLKDPLIRRMGEFMVKSYIGDGWVMNYGDGSARFAANPSLLMRFALHTGSGELSDFVAFTNKGKVAPALSFSHNSGTYRILEAFRYQDVFKEKCGGAPEGKAPEIASEYYPDTQYAILRRDGAVLCAKGGHNAESHNHNDIGSCIYFIDDIPVLVDPGVGKYTKETFSDKRYEVALNRSDWHNTPAPNGVLQNAGRQYAAQASICEKDRGLFSTNIARAYSLEESGCRNWRRSYDFRGRKLIIADSFNLIERKGPDKVYFVTPAEEVVPGDGFITLISRSFNGKREIRVKLGYPAGFTYEITPAELDAKLQKVWRNSLRRITFTSPANAPKAGKYFFNLEKTE